MLMCPEGSLGAIANVQLAKNIREMVFDGAFGQV